MIEFDFKMAHHVRREFGLDKSDGFFFSSRNNRSTPLSRMDILVHDIGHALSLGVSISDYAGKIMGWRDESMLSNIIDDILWSRGVGFRQHNECVVLGSDLFVFEWAGYEVPDDDLYIAHMNSDISRRKLLRVLDTDEPMILAKNVIRWLRRKGVVRGRIPV